MVKNQKNIEEEIDLGSLFMVVGKGFSTFFKKSFNLLFQFIISMLLFFKKNSIKIGVTIIIGATIGAFIEFMKPIRYGSELLVQPNFKSARQLYNTINYYNDLVKQKNTAAIQTTFNLDKEKASSIKKFTIEPILEQNNILSRYDDLILSVDTLTIKSYSFEKFKASFTKYDYKVHKIIVVAEKNNVFEKLGDVIISSVVKNNYFNRLKVLTNENLNRTDSLLRQNLIQVDTLRKVYIQVMLDNAKKQTNGTNINLKGVKRGMKELELFETNRKISSDLKDVAKEKSIKYEVINVISNFQPIGYEIKGINKNYIFLLGMLGAVLVIMFLLIKQINDYLNNYKK